MSTDTKGAKFIRGLVKTVFIGCYAAFMWASIHHVATFFNNFEQGSDTVGSYMLAGAFDITALVTTIGVMFFRKSMPRYVQVIVWVFIIGIAGYSFFINWEYAAHFQNADLVLQPTGATTPVYDQSGTLHYVPEMRQNTSLLFINPLLASGFTIFSLIYSIVAEFFGTKPPTFEELQAKKDYLEQTATILDDIRDLEASRKGKGLIASAKDAALQIKTAVKEVRSGQETIEDIEDDTSMENGPDTDKLNALTSGENGEDEQGQMVLNEEENIIVSHYENAYSWLSAKGSTVPLKMVSETLNVSMKLLHNRVKGGELKATKNREIVFKSSVVKWAISELIPSDSIKIVSLDSARNGMDTSANNQGKTEDKLSITLEAMQDKPDITDEQLAVILGLKRSASARFWRLKAADILTANQRETVNV